MTTLDPVEKKQTSACNAKRFAYSPRRDAQTIFL